LQKDEVPVLMLRYVFWIEKGAFTATFMNKSIRAANTFLFIKCKSGTVRQEWPVGSGECFETNQSDRAGGGAGNELELRVLLSWTTGQLTLR
jgi:hypothetical protein